MSEEAAESTEDRSALTRPEEPGSGFQIPDQDASPGAALTQQNAVNDRQCGQDDLPTPDVREDSRELDEGVVDKQSGEQDRLVETVNAGEAVGQRVVEVEDTSQRTFPAKQGPESFTSTKEGKQGGKRPKVLHGKVITEEEQLYMCKKICITTEENITIETFEDGKQKVVRCTEKHPNVIPINLHW